MATSKECQYITKLSTHDVLCGRGSGPNEQEGNINFRDLVATRKAEYLATNPRDHKNKSRIAREIVDAVRSRGGRFLKRANVEIMKGGPKPYELADEPAVLEKAKQALRQNRAGRTESSTDANAATVYAESHTSNMMHERATQPLPPTDPYEAFMVHLKQTSIQQPYGNGMSPAPAEAAMRNAQMQSYMAAQRQHAMLGQNPYFATAGAAGDPLGMVDPRNTMQQQYKAQQQQQHHPHAKPTNAISGQQQNLSVFREAYGEAAKSEYIRHQAEQQMKHKMQPSSGVAERTTAAATAAASMRHAREQRYQTSVASIGSFEHSIPDAQMIVDAAASMRHAREQHYENSVASIGSSGHSISDAQMMTLENFFLGASQKKSARSDSRSQHQQSDSRPFHHQIRITNNEPFIDGLEDMSLPSMSLGEISDFSAMERASASRSKLSIGGTIIEGAEKDSSMDEASVSDSCNHHAMKPQEIAKRRSGGLPHAPGDRKYDANRHFSFLGSAHNNSLDELASVASVMHSMSDENPPPQLRAQEISLPSHTAIRDLGHLKRQRPSLSSYYREMKASSTTHHEVVSLGR